ncbi:MAG TPA: NADH-quinone oxidoreductase subunit J [Geobacterales bacterium]|nr:NADH-quinone oxidoreductase subunit J [Geobacterales bacterium]
MAQTLFYILALVAVVTTIFCITAKQPVHAILHLVTSFFSLAGIFYLLAAPLVAVFEVIIYAGAIMVLFLFIIMMLHASWPEPGELPSFRQWWPAALLGTVILFTLAMVVTIPSPAASQNPGGVSAFSTLLFTRYGLAVEVISLQLLFALVGALYLGRREP